MDDVQIDQLIGRMRELLVNESAKRRLDELLHKTLNISDLFSNWDGCVRCCIYGSDRCRCGFFTDIE